MRRLIVIAVLTMGPLLALDAKPASACWWGGYGYGYGAYGYGYGAYGYSAYRPVYRRAYAYRPAYAYASYYRPRVLGWRSWGWRRGWRRW
jgi:hypothetical protein